MRRALLLAPVALGALGALGACAACSRDTRNTAENSGDAGLVAHPGSAGSALSATATGVTAQSIARAEDARDGGAIPETVLREPNTATRRLAARAWARIGDATSLLRLDALLGDVDDEVATWAAYGLGFHCRARKTEIARALSARVGTLDGNDTPTRTALREVLRSVGRCDGDGGESLLTQALIRTGNERASVRAAAALGLGEIATRRRTLGAASVGALLEAVDARPVLGEALFALSRAEMPETLRGRAAGIIKKAVNERGPYRLFAIRMLARLDADPAETLRAIAADKDSTMAERVDAARGLAASEKGRDAAAELLTELLPKSDPLEALAFGTPTYALVSTLLASLGADPSHKAEGVLRTVNALTVPDAPKPLARRIDTLRCRAGVTLARGNYENDAVKKCAPEGTYARERARLDSALQRPVTGDRRAVWLAAAKSADRRLREAALEALGAHAELGDAGKKALIEALDAASEPGVVATAAETLFAHPEHAMMLSHRARRAALDPRAPLPTADPERELDPDVARAMRAALARPYAPDHVELRVALVDAGAALRLPAAKEAAEHDCKSANITVRDHAERALGALGIRGVTCTRAEGDSGRDTPAPELTKIPYTHEATLVLTTDAGELRVHLDPALTPITAARVASLGEAGFYKGIVVHRVVPGFVVQFGDPQGDGSGGSGTPLRCETSPRPFEPLAVGMALAGRDTGSSQLFVTLSRTPHLDGAYAIIGRAEGDWNAVAEGDVIQDARVVSP